jgi:integrase/recombinase XerD
LWYNLCKSRSCFKKGGTLQRTIDAFLAWLAEEKGSTANTIAAYRNDLDQFLAWVQAHTMVDAWTGIAERDIRAYWDELQLRGYALTTMARKLSAVRSFFHYLLLTGTLNDDPTLKISIDVPLRPSPERLSRRAAQQLWDSLPGDTPLDLRDRAMIALIAGAGLKSGQLMGLNLADVAPGAGRVEELILPPVVTANLARYVEEGRPVLVRDAGADSPEQPLFVNAQGGRLSRQGLWTVLKRHGQDAGLEDSVSPRSLRGVLKDDWSE